jgi:tRNA U55 pseudouridine synthase TruB
MSYSVVKNRCKSYDLLEKNTSTIIEMSVEDETLIRSMCRKLNLGSGFNGWTPTFIAKKLLTYDGS